MGKHEAEVAEMVLLLILTVALFASCVCFVWPRAAEPESTAFETEQDCLRGPSPTGEPGSREGVLVHLLLTSGITRRQYQRSLELLAARDDERHPLAMPPEGD
jgi:hypothetical protein